MAITIVASTVGDEAATTTATATFADYTPAENDVVVLFRTSATNANPNVAFPASGWVNPLGEQTFVEPSDSSMSLVCVYHLVTAGEASGVTTTYACPTMLSGVGNDGHTFGVVLRGVDATSVVDAIGSFAEAGTAATHTLPALAGADLSAGSTVVGFVTPDGLGTYTTPAGWTLLETSPGTYQGGVMLVRDTTTSAGVDIAATNITPSVSDEYCSISIAFTDAGGEDPEPGQPTVQVRVGGVWTDYEMFVRVGGVWV